MNNAAEISLESCLEDSVLEEDTSSRLSMRSNGTEQLEEETSKATSNVLGVQESLEQGQMSNWSEGLLFSNDISTNHSSLHTHFVSFKLQLDRQKAEYDAKIVR